MCTSNRELASHIVKPGTSHRCAPSRAPRSTRITGPTEHETSRIGRRNGDAWRRGHEERVPGIRRSPSGRRQTESPSAVPGSRTRVSENEEGVTAGVRSLRMCRRRFEHVWAHSQGGHPREGRNGEACIGDGAGRRDARRWPKSTVDDECRTPPQGDEPERRRDKRRTRRQAEIPEKRAQRRCASPREKTPMVPAIATTTELRTGHLCSRRLDGDALPG
jgi:hypothetical protein